MSVGCVLCFALQTLATRYSISFLHTYGNVSLSQSSCFITSLGVMVSSDTTLITRYGWDLQTIGPKFHRYGSSLKAFSLMHCLNWFVTCLLRLWKSSDNGVLEKFTMSFSWFIIRKGLWILSGVQYLLLYVLVIFKEPMKTWGWGMT